LSGSKEEAWRRGSKGKEVKRGERKKLSPKEENSNK
jgi:hypothetical protein